jgi:hypothetical protein
MNKLLTLAVLGCGLWFTAPGQATPLPQSRSREGIQKTQQIDLTGTLEWVKGGPDPKFNYVHFTGHVIKVNGITYQLISVDANSAALLGQRVRVKGVLTVTEEAVGYRGNGKDPVPMIAMLVKEHWVALTEIAAAPDTQVAGKLDMHASFGYPRVQEVPALEARDESYVLTFASPALEKFAAKYDGKSVILRGSRGPGRSFTVMCKGNTLVPGFVVREIEVIDNDMVLKASACGDGTVVVTERLEVRGRLIAADCVPDSEAYAGLWCMVEVHGKTHWLDLGRLDSRAATLVGQQVVLTGRLAQRPAGPQVILVDSLLSLDPRV